MPDEDFEDERSAGGRQEDAEHPTHGHEDVGHQQDDHEEGHDGEDLVVVQIERKRTKDFAVIRTPLSAVRIQLGVLAAESQSALRIIPGKAELGEDVSLGCC